MDKENKHFMAVFWFIVGLCAFGAAYSVFLIIYLPVKVAERLADTSQIFWLSTAVGGGIGYLIGSSANQQKKPDTGTVISAADEGTKTTVIQEPTK